MEDTIVILNDDYPILSKDYKVPSMDGKYEANMFFRKLNVPTTFLYTSWYYENF